MSYERRSRILIVDDEPKNVDILEYILEQDYDLKSVGTGEEALELIPIYRPDLILLDIMMPGLDGYEVCRKVKNDPALKFVKVILVSGKALLEERLIGYECGADDYITKPFDSDELIAKIKVFLRLKNVEEVSAIKDNFLTLISHETNTPLNGILGLTEMLLSSQTINSEDHEVIVMISDCGKRLHEFLCKTRLLCELKSGPDLTSHTESLQSCLIRAISIVMDRTERKKKNIEIECNIPDDLLFKLDWGYMVKPFEFIIDNAVKYGESGSKVTVKAVAEGDYWTIAISNFGVGITDADMPSIFSEFTVSDLKHHRNGQGLSLAISQKIVEQHKGRIRVVSIVGGKTTFLIDIPRELEAYLVV